MNRNRLRRANIVMRTPSNASERRRWLPETGDLFPFGCRWLSTQKYTNNQVLTTRRAVDAQA
jgi:hypothetical protein